MWEVCCSLLHQCADQKLRLQAALFGESTWCLLPNCFKLYLAKTSPAAIHILYTKLAQTLGVTRWAFRPNHLRPRHLGEAAPKSRIPKISFSHVSRGKLFAVDQTTGRHHRSMVCAMKRATAAMLPQRELGEAQQICCVNNVSNIVQNAKTM